MSAETQTPWHRFLAARNLLELRVFYTYAYFLMFFFYWPIRFYYGLEPGPPSLVYQLSKWVIYGPVFGMIVLWIGIPKNKKNTRSKIQIFVLSSAIGFIIIFVTVIVYGLTSSDAINLETFIVALFGLFTITFFAALFFIILNVSKLKKTFEKRYEIWTVILASIALLLTIISSHGQVSVGLKNILSGTAAIIVVLAAPVQLAKLIYEFHQIK